MGYRYTITAKSAGDKNLKIGQYLAKLWTTVESPIFDSRGTHSGVILFVRKYFIVLNNPNHTSCVKATEYVDRQVIYKRVVIFAALSMMD